MEGALTEYQSFRVKGSTALFLRPFLPLERRLFLREGSVFPLTILGLKYESDSLSDSHDCDSIYQLLIDSCAANESCEMM